MVHWAKKILCYKCYIIHIQFDEKGSPHDYSFIWVLNAPSAQKESFYIKFIGKAINAQLHNSFCDPQLFELANTYEVYCSL